MTTYDLVVIGGTLEAAQAECERWAKKQTTPGTWAAITPDMLRHFAVVGARDVKVLCDVRLMAADYDAIDAMMARATPATEQQGA